MHFYFIGYPTHWGVCLDGVLAIETQSPKLFKIRLGEILKKASKLPADQRQHFYKCAGATWDVIKLLRQKHTKKQLRAAFEKCRMMKIRIPFPF